MIQFDPNTNAIINVPNSEFIIAPGSPEQNEIDENDQYITDGVTQDFPYTVKRDFEFSANMPTSHLKSLFHINAEFGDKGLLNWVGLSGIKLKTSMVLKDFYGYKVYASVHGRVDDEDGTYTGIPALLLGEDYSQDTIIRQRNVAQRGGLSKIPRPTKIPKKPLKKLIKKAGYK